jgi:hypothetical protein
MLLQMKIKGALSKQKARDSVKINPNAKPVLTKPVPVSALFAQNVRLYLSHDLFLHCVILNSSDFISQSRSVASNGAQSKKTSQPRVIKKL